MLDRLDRQINVEFRPVEVLGLRPRDPQQLTDGSVEEPRELLEGDEQLSLIQQEPEPVAGDVGDLNAESGPSTPCGFHLLSPGSGEEPE
jgi:hypothetical protein